MLDPFAGQRAQPDDDPQDDPLYRTGEPIGTMGELRTFLGEREDTQALEQLADGDRLGMLRRVGIWLDKHSYLLDFRRMVYESLPMVVAAGPTIRGSEDMDAWLEGTIEVASGLLLDEDVRLAQAGAPVPEPIEPRLLFLMGNLMFDPSNVRRAVVAANSLKPAERQVFYHCFVMGKGFSQYELEGGPDSARAHALLIGAIDKLSAAVGDL
jgi:hypothetical protein